MNKAKHFLCLMFSVLIFSAALPACADIYWESQVESKGTPKGMSSNLPQILMGQFNKSDTVKYWLSELGMRTESREGIMILDYRTMTFYNLYPNNKTYMKTDMSAMAEKGKAPSAEMKIIPTDESKNISGYPCRKYRVTLTNGEGEYWLSKEMKVYEEYKKLREKLKTAVGKNSAAERMKIPGLKEEMDGFPVMTRMEVMGITTTSTVKQAGERKTDASLYKVPDDYRLLDIKNIFNIKQKQGKE
ncbi:MAG: DUF4412 domain-containing protein [Desulfobacterales bacterium]